jgi:hypothetical protein
MKNSTFLGQLAILTTFLRPYGVSRLTAFIESKFLQIVKNNNSSYIYYSYVKSYIL